MINAQLFSRPGTDDREDEDTIEIQLTPTELEILVCAAEDAQRDAGRQPIAEIPSPEIRLVPDNSAATAPSSRRRGPLYLAAATGSAILLTLSVTIAYQLGVRMRPAPTALPAHAEHATATAPANLPAPVISSPPPKEEPAAPVHFTNPFDRSEIFEFPPGTSDAEARDAVAALLLERAQQRQSSPASNGSPPKPEPPSLAQRT